MNTLLNGIFISEDGGVSALSLTATELAVPENIIASLSADMVLKSRLVAEVEPGCPASLCLGSGNISYWTVHLSQLPLRCPYALNDKGELVPNVSGKDNVLELFWTPPSSMRLEMLIPVEAQGAQFVCREPYLLAFDEKCAWRLPLANLYEDGKLCMGSYHSRSGTQLGCIKLALNQLKSGQWSADLADRTVLEHTRALFRFKANNSGFDQVSVANWQKYCNKVVIGNLQYVAL